MTPEEVLAFMQAEAKISHSWLEQSARMRQNAAALEPADPVMATMLRRMALSIEQYQERVRAYLILQQIEKQEKATQEADQLVNDLFARVGKGRST